ncbi:solute carrier family 35 member D3-like [Saccoglossus kowalevskii]|uniref:Solute carrier family 35 member D3-like n=1 Tax=Saccoglossus kowalevskii TaxID=10224 RepID=A0ABM0M4T1_SACKO|nr:PREDICTED: solute carrier family 35 member D3-like [Saccoglossus kowalevskii]
MTKTVTIPDDEVVDDTTTTSTLTTESYEKSCIEKKLDFLKLAVNMSVAAAVFYGICSGSMPFINKIVVTTYDFRHPNFIMLGQMIFTASLLEMLRKYGIVDVPPYSIALGKDVLIASVCYTFHSVFALSALGDMNIPMYNVIKRCVPLVNLILAPIILKKGRPSLCMVCSVTLITAGCIVAGQFTINSYYSKILYCMGGCPCDSAM